VEREGAEVSGGEITQTLYAHMNRRNNFKKAVCLKAEHPSAGFILLTIAGKKKKNFYIISKGLFHGMVDMLLFSCKSFSLELNFCYQSFNLSCGYFLGKAQSQPQYWRAFCILPQVLSFSVCCSPSWSILLMGKPGRYPTSLIPRGVSHTFTQLPKPERLVSPQTGLLRVLWEVIRLPFCLLKAGLIFNPVSYQSDRQDTQLAPKPSLISSERGK
jgi:hypothetical protein